MLAPKKLINELFLNLTQQNMETNQEKKTIERVKRVLIDVLSVEESELTLETSFRDDLGADSLDNVTLICALEEEFGDKIDDSDAEKLITVGDTVKFIEEKMMNYA